MFSDVLKYGGEITKSGDGTDIASSPTVVCAVLPRAVARLVFGFIHVRKLAQSVNTP